MFATNFATNAAMEATANQLIGLSMNLPANKTSENPMLAMPSTRDVVSRFGKVTLHKDRAIELPKGFVGMPEKHFFALVDFPISKLSNFKLMQCFTDDELAFMVLPIGVENSFISKAHVQEAIQILEIPEKDLVMLLVVTVHRQVGAVSLSVNVRAPVFLDAERRTGAQYVLPHSEYEIRQMINAAGERLNSTYDD